MEFSTILLKKRNGLAKIILNRPQVLNALSHELLDEVHMALLDASQDESVSVVVISGAGRAFSSGADMRGSSFQEEINSSIRQDGQVSSKSTRKRSPALSVIETIEEIEKPVVAAVHGYCLTGALELVTACDIIIASEDAIFGDTHARWGLTPTWGGSQRLPRIIGEKKAKEMIFTCSMLSAAEAYRIGLVNKVVSSEKLDDEVEKLCKDILQNSSMSIAIQKSLINRGMKMDYNSALKMAEADSPGKTKDTEERLRKFSSSPQQKDKDTG